MRCLAVGDIHGCLTALETLAAAALLDTADLTITLGDYTDRGPNSRGVLDWLIRYQASHRLVALRGNHDIMMLAAREEGRLFYDWLSFGGNATLQSYASGDSRGTLRDIPDRHWHFLENTRPIYETGAHFFVHAGVHPSLPLDDQPESVLYWEKIDNPAPHMSGKRMICGHTAQRTGLPKSFGHAVCLDTWVYGDGWLTCLDVESGQYWQANESGDHREGWLEDQPPQNTAD